VDQLVKKFFDRICQTYRSEAGNNPRFAAVAGELQVEKIVGLLEMKWRYQQQLEYYRRDGRLWVLHPTAWLARVRRDAKAREVAQLKAEGLRILRSKSLCG
jgi:hypothetical protein